MNQTVVQFCFGPNFETLIKWFRHIVHRLVSTTLVTMVGTMASLLYEYEFESNSYVFFKGAIPGLLFFILVFLIYLTENNVQCIFCLWLDSNRGPLVSELTALPSEPQPLPKNSHLFVACIKAVNVVVAKSKFLVSNPFENIDLKRGRIKLSFIVANWHYAIRYLVRPASMILIGL